MRQKDGTVISKQSDYISQTTEVPKSFRRDGLAPKSS